MVFFYFMLGDENQEDEIKREIKMEKDEFEKNGDENQEKEKKIWKWNRKDDGNVYMLDLLMKN